MAKKKRKTTDALTLEKPNDENAIRLLRMFALYQGGEFQWDQHLKEPDKDKPFVLSVLGQAEVKGFKPSQKQLNWAKSIVDTLNDAAGKERIVRKISNKPPSSDPKWVARRAAKLVVWEARLSFTKQFPADLEIAQKLYQLGAIQEEPTGLTALRQILAWHEQQKSGNQVTGVVT